MPTVLITGANRGIGLEFARQYSAAGWRVLSTCRDPESADSLRACVSAVHRLELTDAAAVRALARTLEAESIDVLIANAGVMSAHPKTAPGDIPDAAFLTDFSVNAIAALRCAAAFAPLVARSRERKLIAISSLLGSMASNTIGSHYSYRASKAALNSLWRTFAIDHPELIAVTLSPGLLRTDMTRYEQAWDALNDPAPRVEALRAVIAGLTQASSGSAVNFNGETMPW